MLAQAATFVPVAAAQNVSSKEEALNVQEEKKAEPEEDFGLSLFD
jgi:hypothetical protein